MKIAILWTSWSNYMDACARSLQSFTGAEISIVCNTVSSAAPYEKEDFFQFPCKVFDIGEVNAINANHFDLIIFCGVNIPKYREVARKFKGRAVRVLCIDMQWVGTFRQALGVVAFRLYLRSLFEFIFVPGWRQSEWGSRMGFSASKIIEGHYACDSDKFLGESSSISKSKRFVFAGRLVREKGVDILAQAWQRFVQSSECNDWSLDVCGVGELEQKLIGLPRVNMLGFVQPAQLAQVMSLGCALVLPSRKEPWGVVIHEAASCGLPLIVSNRCGSSDYFCRENLNGFFIKSLQEKELFEALKKFAGLSFDTRFSMSERSKELSRQRSSLTWAMNVTRALI